MSISFCVHPRLVEEERVPGYLVPYSFSRYHPSPELKEWAKANAIWLSVREGPRQRFYVELSNEKAAVAFKLTFVDGIIE